MGQSVLLLSWRAIKFPAWKLTSKIITSIASKSKVLDTHTHKNPWHVISTKSIQTPEILDRKKRKVYRERSTNPSQGVGHTGESTLETAPAAANTELSMPNPCVLAHMSDTEHDQGWGLSLPGSGSAILGALGCVNSAPLRTTQGGQHCPLSWWRREQRGSQWSSRSGPRGPRANAAELRTGSLEKEHYRRSSLHVGKFTKIFCLHNPWAIWKVSRGRLVGKNLQKKIWITPNSACVESMGHRWASQAQHTERPEGGARSHQSRLGTGSPAGQSTQPSPGTTGVVHAGPELGTRASSPTLPISENGSRQKTFKWSTADHFLIQQKLTESGSC